MSFSYPPHLTILAWVFSDFFFWLTTKCSHAVPKCEQMSYQYSWPTLATYNKSCEWCEVKKQLSNKSPVDGFPFNYCGRKTVMSLTGHQMETFSALLALCAGNSPATGEFPSQRPVTRSFDVFFDLRLNKRLSKQSRRWWFGTPSCSLWCHRNALIWQASCDM